MANATIYPIFESSDGTPFVFWDTQKDQLLIRHGQKFTVIYYDMTTCLSCKTMFTGMQLLKDREVFIYNDNGRIVASFLPQKNVLIVKRDGRYLSFEFENPPIGYGDCAVDKIPISLFYSPGNDSGKPRVNRK